MVHVATTLERLRQEDHCVFETVCKGGGETKFPHRSDNSADSPSSRSRALTSPKPAPYNRKWGLETYAQAVVYSGSGTALSLMRAGRWAFTCRINSVPNPIASV